MREDDYQALQEENVALREENATLRALVAELWPLKAQVEQLSEQARQWESRQAKDSHNSHLPPSSDRFVRQPRSLRKPSGKKPGGQPGHPGQHLKFSATPDEVIVAGVCRCQHCQADLQAVKG